MGITARFSRVLALQRFLISGGQFGNRCRFFPVYSLLRAVILDLRAQFENRCKDFLVYAFFGAMILDFRGGVNLGIAARISSFMPSLVQ